MVIVSWRADGAAAVSQRQSVDEVLLILHPERTKQQQQKMHYFDSVFKPIPGEREKKKHGTWCDLEWAEGERNGNTTPSPLSSAGAKMHQQPALMHAAHLCVIKPQPGMHSSCGCVLVTAH